jgi:hypothetical protein
MKNYIIRFLAISFVMAVSLSMVYSCGNNAGTTLTTAPPLSVTLTLIPSSGTLNAVNVGSTFSEVIPASAGIVNPNSIQIAVSPSFLFTQQTSLSYVSILPSGNLPAGTTFSVTTNFLTIQNNTLYAATAYNTFTTSTTP